MLIQYAYHGIVKSLKPIMRVLAFQIHISEWMPVGQAHHICIPTIPPPHNCEMLMNEDVYLTSVDRTCCQEGLSGVLSKKCCVVATFLPHELCCQCIVHVQHIFVNLRSCAQSAAVSVYVNLYICACFVFVTLWISGL